MSKLAVIVLGNRRSGKSTTWNELFGRTVRTGTGLRDLDLSDGNSMPVFLISGSPQERRRDIEGILNNDPRVLLCSLQYTESARDSISYLVANSYALYVQWLNPGFDDLYPSPDVLGFTGFLLHNGAVLTMRDATEPAYRRVREIRDFLTGWASRRRLGVRQPA
jgi:hypothetical protein